MPKTQVKFYVEARELEVWKMIARELGFSNFSEFLRIVIRLGIEELLMRRGKFEMREVIENVHG